MVLQLKILTGPQAGRTFKLGHGMTVGRADSDITINDPKISGRHAKIEISKSGQLVLTDLGSTNGTRVNGARITQVELKEGLVVKIGYTDCLIEPYVKAEKRTPSSTIEVPPHVHENKHVNLRETPQKKEKAADVPSPADLPPVPSDGPIDIVEEPQDWSAFFSAFSEKAQSKVVSAPRSLQPFKPLLKFTAIKGLHAGQSWLLGYGPRTFGLQSLDNLILDTNTSDIYFTVTPEGRAAKFVTKSPEQIQLNGQLKTSELLKDGDLIQFENTLLKVSFEE